VRAAVGANNISFSNDFQIQRRGVIDNLEHFQEKWIPVFRRKCDQTKNLEHDQFPPKLNML
jgi:hypothetical protein